MAANSVSLSLREACGGGKGISAADNVSMIGNDTVALKNSGDSVERVDRRPESYCSTSAEQFICPNPSGDF